jgi:hypothetical protein
MVIAVTIKSISSWDESSDVQTAKRRHDPKIQLIVLTEQPHGFGALA